MLAHRFRICVVAIFLTFTLVMATGAAASEIDASGLLRAGDYQKLNDYYSELQDEFSAGKISGDRLRDAFRGFYPTDADLAPHFDAWVKAFPHSYVARLARGIYYKRLGLNERGGNYIAETPQNQIDKMNDALAKAANDLGASVEMNSKPFLSYLHTMDIGRQYISNVQLRKVFDRGAALDPTSYAIRIKFMVALEPKWGGNSASMRSFLEECRKAKLTDSNMRELESMVHEAEGYEFRRSGNLAAAEAAYRKALALGPCSCDGDKVSLVSSELNEILFDTHQYAAAIVLLDDLLQQKPGNLWALRHRGLAKFNLHQASGALSDWQQAAERGDSYSQSQLGMLYLTGAPGGVDHDYTKSVYWLRKAAVQGEFDAQANLARAEVLAARDPAAR